MNREPIFFAFNDSTANTQAIAENWMEDDEWLEELEAHELSWLSPEELAECLAREEANKP